MLTTPVVITWPLSGAPPEHLHDQAEHPRLQTAGTQHHHEVADLADLVTGRVEDREPGQARREDAGGGGAHE
jgi:hypothetical protein